MKRATSLCLLLSGLLLSACASAPSTSEWPIVYQQDFADFRCIEQFAFSDATRWRCVNDDGSCYLELLGKSDYKPPVRSPRSIALIPDIEVADFDLDVDLLQTGGNYGHRDLCLFFGFQSAQRFYYTHLATSPDQNAHNIFRVHDAPRTNIAPVAEHGIDWGRDEWHHVRIERRVAPGTIRVYWDDQTEPILAARCAEFDWGRLGFGSFDDSGRVANVVVSGPASRALSETSPFPR